MEQTQTAVSLNRAELQALIDLFRIAQMRLSTAEQLYYDGLIARFDQELSTQEAEMKSNDDVPHLGPAAPLPNS